MKQIRLWLTLPLVAFAWVLMMAASLISGESIRITVEKP